MQLSQIERHENKYILNSKSYFKVKNDLLPFMEIDKYSFRSSTGAYLVRSLYYDTPDYQAYQDKLDGFYGRSKFRLRCYQDIKEDCSSISVEIKTKLGNTVVKHCKRVNIDFYENFIRTNHWPELNDAILIDFERTVLLRSLSPVVLVEYNREGMCDNLGEGVRVTFDHNLRSADTEELFSNSLFLQKHIPDHIIMEVKSHSVPPEWLRDIIRRNGLRLVAYSKYVQAILDSKNCLYSAPY